MYLGILFIYRLKLIINENFFLFIAQSLVFVPKKDIHHDLLPLRTISGVCPRLFEYFSCYNEKK